MAKADKAERAIPTGGAVRDQEVLDQLMAALPNGAQYVLLQRQDDSDPNVWAHSGKIPATDFNHESVKEYYGGGKYRMQVVGERGKFISPKVEFDIDKRFQPTKGPLAVAATTTAGHGDAAPGALGKIEKLLEMNLMLSLQGRNTPPAGPVSDPFQGALKIAELMKTTAPAQGISPKEVLDLILKGMDLAGGKGGERSGFTALADASTPLFSALAKTLEVDAETKAQRAQLRLAGGGHNPPTTPQPGASNVIPWQEAIRPYIPQLIGLARQDKDPAFYADFVLDNLPPEIYDQVEAEARKLTSGEFAQMFLSTFPDLAVEVPVNVKGWALTFLAEAHTLLLPVEGQPGE